MISCPKCKGDSSSVTVEIFDGGRSSETGYHDYSETYHFQCLDPKCGFVGDQSDFVVEAVEVAA